MHAVTLATFNEKEPAEALRGRLEQAGVPAKVCDHHRAQRLLFARENLASITVEVDRDDYLRGRSLAEQWDAQEGVLKQAVHCPQCGSPRVEYPQYTRKFLTPAFHLSLGIALGLIKKEFYCEDCQYTWPPETRLEPERDLLGWPRKAPR